jgi:acetylglutamate kinase
MEAAIKKAEVLIEALPYIRQFRDRVIVIKYGGSILGEEKIRRIVLQDIVFLHFVGLRPVLVHGGGPNISDRMRQTGKKASFVDGMRVTDEETLEVVEEELRKLNATIVKEIAELGAQVKGISGKDGLIQAEKKMAKIDLGLVGNIIGIETETVAQLFRQHAIPVILPMGRGAQDHKTYNVNADEAAAHIAAGLKAEKLVLLTNVKGIMRNPDDPHSFISTLTEAEAKNLKKEAVIQAGMIPKVDACISALDRGVKKTHIVDACIPHALLLEIFTDKGIGTEIVLK